MEQGHLGVVRGPENREHEAAGLDADRELQMRAPVQDGYGTHIHR